MKTTIPALPEDGTPNAGARKMAGKSNDAEANLLGHDHANLPVTAVKEAEEDKGAARKCIDIQVDGDGGPDNPNGNPKKRARNYWGRDSKDEV